jgi:hypothetical protein
MEIALSDLIFQRPEDSVGAGSELNGARPPVSKATNSLATIIKCRASLDNNIK